ncbi:hypothetical protein CH63R_14558 [Colletotrichum higginsianum IMI 349063]|uniref:Uncharacterized protein n=1 Tax=Colletotrichum higginsianum (strain IMI 349063) TaxID=759273 RepID=A0A1B7XQE1_COLHI|nr:hypothetical protein CH63R_14558 [Colletotrichum higginsianum IMI 349063]OBR01986.1 hypothetical protein CH63R_14558 [Colletotrichum higginsianum IMI 349063]GJD05474.1 hypothetical protein ColKHC_14299 [Colletotrichum higginsianum]
MLASGLVLLAVILELSFDDDGAGAGDNTTELVIHDRLQTISEAYTSLFPLVRPISDVDTPFSQVIEDRWMASRITQSAG